MAQSGWTVTEAAKPYAGTTIKAVYLDRPGYKAAAKLVPEFEKLTGITVENEVIPYENTREKMVLDFTSQAGTYDVALTDVVWVGEYAANGWLTPLEKFTSDQKLADPALNLKGFFPILLDSFGTWDKKLYGIPFDNYAGLLFYNRCMLEKAGFKSPPSVPDSFNVNPRKCVQQLYEPIKHLASLTEHSSQQRQPQSKPSPYQPLVLVTSNRALTSNQHAPDVHDHQQANQPIQPVMKHHVCLLDPNHAPDGQGRLPTKAFAFQKPEHALNPRSYCPCKQWRTTSPRVHSCR